MSSRITKAKIATILFATAMAATAFGQHSSLYSQGKQAFAAGHYAEAAKLFHASSGANERVSDPSAADALFMEGKSFANLGELGEAERALNSYLQQSPRSAPALYLLGYVLQRENKPKESLINFTKAAAIVAPHADDLRVVALDYVLLNDYPDAIHWLSIAVQQDPLNSEAWYDLGRAQMGQGEFVLAKKSFDRVLALSPHDPRALNNLGLCYEAQNRLPDALHSYEAAIAAQKGTAHPSEQPLLNYGNLLVSENRAVEAIAALEPAIRIAPKNAKCHEALAHAYQKANRLPEAEQQMEEAVALDPTNPRLHYQLGRLYHRAGQAERAKAELALSQKLYGSHSTAESK